MAYIPLILLRQERERRGWSRNYVAECIEVDVVTVGRWERGERMPHPYHRQKLCGLFEMNAQDLGLLSILPQEPQDAVIITDLSSEVPDTITAATGPSEPTSSTQHTKASSLLFNPRRKFLLGLGGLGALAIAGGSVIFTSRSLPAPAPILMPLSKRSHHFIDPNTNNWVNHMAWSPDNSNMATANGTNIITIWNLQNGGLVLYYSTLNGWVNDISWSKANVIAAATADFHEGSLQLWKFPDEKPIFTLKRPYGFQSVSWSPDGKYLALSGRNPTVEVWDPFASKLVGHYSDSTLGLLGIRRVQWSASGKYLACGADDGTIHVWEALTNKPRTICRQHMGRVIDLAWSPNEQYIISASADKTSQIWEVSSGRSVLTYRGHTDEVEGVDWSPQSTYVASGSADRTAHVWEPSTGRLIAKYAGRSSTVEAVLWSVDGNTLAIGTKSEGTEIWQAPSH